MNIEKLTAAHSVEDRNFFKLLGVTTFTQAMRYLDKHSRDWRNYGQLYIGHATPHTDPTSPYAEVMGGRNTVNASFYRLSKSEISGGCQYRMCIYTGFLEKKIFNEMITFFSVLDPKKVAEILNMTLSVLKEPVEAYGFRELILTMCDYSSH